MAMMPFQVPDRFNATSFFVDRHVADEGSSSAPVVDHAIADDEVVTGRGSRRDTTHAKEG